MGRLSEEVKNGWPVVESPVSTNEKASYKRE